MDEEKKNSNNSLINLFDHASEGWEESNFQLEEAPVWADYEFDFIVYSERDNYFYFFLARKVSFFFWFLKIMCLLTYKSPLPAKTNGLKYSPLQKNLSFFCTN